MRYILHNTLCGEKSNTYLFNEIMNDNIYFPQKKQKLNDANLLSTLSYPSLMGFGTCNVYDPAVIENAFKIGYRHFDLAESYNNLAMVKTALDIATSPFSKGGFGLSRSDIWLTMKVAKLNGDHHVDDLLIAVGTSYFDLLLYHKPFDHFGTEEETETSWRIICEQPTNKVKHVGVSNFYSPHLSRLLRICTSKGLQIPFANEILINPYTYGNDQDVIQLCKENNIFLIAYSPLGFYYSMILLADKEIVSASNKFGITPAQLVLTWLMSKNISVIPKSDDEFRQAENYKSLAILDQIGFFIDEITKSLDNLTNDDEFYTFDPALSSKAHGQSLLEYSSSGVSVLPISSNTADDVSVELGAKELRKNTNQDYCQKDDAVDSDQDHY